MRRYQEVLTNQLSFPEVSVLMTTRNRPHLIGKAVDSILKQTFKDFELLIVDASSDDKTKKIVLSYNDPRIIYLRGNGNIAWGRNFGLKQAIGDYITYCDDDELPYPNRLKKLKGLLDKHPDVGLIYTDILKYIKDKKISTIISYDFNKYRLEVYCFFGVGNVMHRRKCIEKIGFFDEHLEVAEDWDMWLRISDYFKIAHLPKILHKSLIHGLNVTITKRKLIGKNCEYIFKKRLKHYSHSRKDLKNYISCSALGTIRNLLGYKCFNFAYGLTDRFCQSIKNYQTLGGRGLCELAKGNFKKAQDFFRESLTNLPKNWQKQNSWIIENVSTIKVNLAQTHYKLGNIDKAIKICKEVLELIPENIEAKIVLASCYVRRGLYRKALGLLNYEGVESISDIQNLRGSCYFMQKRYERAIQEFKKATLINPDTLIYHYNLATAYVKIGNYDKAKSEFQKVLQLEPTHKEAKEALKRIYAKI